MILPIFVLLIAGVGAALVAYGVDPDWMQYRHGFELILLTRRFEWPLVALTLAACVAMFGLVVAGKRRAWWLVGLAPILALLGHRLALNPNDSFIVNSQPEFVSADRAAFMDGDDWVVGLIDGPDAVAFPYAALYSQPLVVRGDEAEPMLLMWSPFANSATAFRVDRSIRANELEVVSMPGNAMLVYNSRIGQFINGVTGRTPDGRNPAGFGSSIATIKTTWERWIAAHPTTLVMSPPPNAGDAPRRAVLPFFPMPPDAAGVPKDETIALIRGTPTLAILDSDLGDGPVNFSDPPIIVLRNPLTGAVTAFQRRVDEDLVPEFSARKFRKFPRAVMTDADSGSAWTADGRAIDGPLKGKTLQQLETEDRVYLCVARAWFGDLKMVAPVPVKSGS